MEKKKLYTIDEAKNLTISEVHQLYRNFINPNQTDIFSSLPFGHEIFNSAEGVHIFSSKSKESALQEHYIIIQKY